MIVPRAPSGIPGLDAIIQGGFPTNSTIALRAEPSNHSEYFQQQFIVEGLKQGRSGVYCCLSRPAASVIKSLRLQGFDVLEQIANDQLVFLDCYSMHRETALLGLEPSIQKKVISVTEPDDEKLLQDGLAAAVERIRDLKGIRAVCESIPGTLTTRNAVDMMRWGRKAFGELRAYEILALHTFPLGVREELFSAMAHDFDAILEIRAERASERVRYFLSIQKMRMTDFPPKLHELETEGMILSLETIQRIV